MGVSVNAALAFGKAVASTGSRLPVGGNAFISVKEEDKETACYLARRLRNLGFTIIATSGTARTLNSARIPAVSVNKVMEGSPHIVDSIKDGEIAMVINTTHGTKAIRDSYSIRRNALLEGVPYFTTIAAGVAAVEAMEAAALIPAGSVAPVRSIQEWHARSHAHSKLTER